MRAAIFNPYLDTLGGGERYSMGIASMLTKSGYEVKVQWKDAGIKKKLQDRFGINLNGIEFVQDVKRGDGYDLMFWVSDGSVPLLRARRNLLHFQIPFINVNGRSLLNRMKFVRIEKIICNSFFTKSIIDKEYGVKSIVIYPPVEVNKIKPKRKENTILSVGRFSQLTQAKHQDILIKAFKKLVNSKFTDWRLILAGGSEVGGSDFLKKLKRNTGKYPIQIIENPDFDQIKDLYGKAKIYWSASGYGVNAKKEPKGVEHFGIAVVEAMAGGAVPIIYNAGGHREIITDGENGILWNNIRNLVKRTSKVISNEKYMRTLSVSSKEKAKEFSYSTFENTISEWL